MKQHITIAYNAPVPSRYDALGEKRAACGVLDAVAAVHKSLLEMGYLVCLLPLMPPIENACNTLKSLETSLVFNLFEGFPGQPETEAILPGILRQHGLRYTGCPDSALKLGLNKAEAKEILKENGIATPNFQLLNQATIADFHLSLPCIVKPGKEDASHGIAAENVVSDVEALSRQVARINRLYGGDALVEEYIDGPEFNATVFGNGRYTVLPVSEIAFSLPDGMPRILTFAAKWEPDNPYFQGTKVVCPAQIPPEDNKIITKAAKQSFQLVCRQGYGRVDMRRDSNGKLYVLEVNPNPDISPGAGAAIQAKAFGMDYTRLIAKIIETALGECQG